MYSVETDVNAAPAVAALPSEAFADYAELRVFLETTPLNADLLNPRRAGANMGSITFGPHGLGLVVFYVLQDQRRVVIVRVVWLG